MVEHRTALFVVTIIGIFGILMTAMPAAFFTNQGESYATEYPQPEVPDTWDLSSIGRDDILDSETLNVTRGTHWYFNLTRIATNDTEIEMTWADLFPNWLEFSHKHGYILIWPVWVAMSPTRVQKDYCTYHAQDDNQTQLFLRCQHGDIPEILLTVTFNTTAFSNLTQAWDDGNLTIYLHYLHNATQQEAHYDAWTLVGQLLTFQSPDIHPLLNAIIAIPIWAGIIITVIYIIEKITPFS